MCKSASIDNSCMRCAYSRGQTKIDFKSGARTWKKVSRSCGVCVGAAAATASAQQRETCVFS